MLSWLEGKKSLDLEQTKLYAVTLNVHMAVSNRLINVTHS